MIGQITRSRLVTHDGDGSGTKMAGTIGTSGETGHGETSGDNVIKLTGSATDAAGSGDDDKTSGHIVLSGGAGEMTAGDAETAGIGESLPPSADTAGDGLELTEWTAPDSLVAGRFDAIRVEAGTDLTIEGFVFGEDLVSFASDAAAASYTRNVWQDGADLVMGETGTGTVRLVGVFTDPAFIHHEGAGAIAA